MIKPPRVDYFGNTSISLFFKANDKFVLGPMGTPKKLKDVIEERLKVGVITLTADGSDLIGLYTGMNNNGIIISNLFSDEEVKKIKEIAKQNGMNVYVSKDVHNANGNNLCANDYGGIINPDISSTERKKMGDVLGVELIPFDVAGYKTVGSMCIATNKGFLCHNDVSPEGLAELEKIFKVKGLNTTINFGVPFAGTGVLANTKGYLVGSESTGVEIQRVEEGLDLIK